MPINRKTFILMDTTITALVLAFSLLGLGYFVTRGNLLADALGAFFPETSLESQVVELVLLLLAIGTIVGFLIRSPFEYKKKTNEDIISKETARVNLILALVALVGNLVPAILFTADLSWLPAPVSSGTSGLFAAVWVANVLILVLLFGVGTWEVRAFKQFVHAQGA